MKCPMCGNDKFESGIARGHYDFKFISDDSGWLTKATVFGGKSIKAKRCTGCGFVALFAK